MEVEAPGSLPIVLIAPTLKCDASLQAERAGDFLKGIEDLQRFGWFKTLGVLDKSPSPGHPSPR